MEARLYGADGLRTAWMNAILAIISMVYGRPSGTTFPDDTTTKGFPVRARDFGSVTEKFVPEVI